MRKKTPCAASSNSSNSPLKKPCAAENSLILKKIFSIRTKRTKRNSDYSFHSDEKEKALRSREFSNSQILEKIKPDKINLSSKKAEPHLLCTLSVNTL